VKIPAEMVSEVKALAEGLGKPEFTIREVHAATGEPSEGAWWLLYYVFHSDAAVGTFERVSKTKWRLVVHEQEPEAVPEAADNGSRFDVGKVKKVKKARRARGEKKEEPMPVVQ
jgi:hypothetical protein